MKAIFSSILRLSPVLLLLTGAPYASGQALPVQQATLMEPQQKTPEVSTDELLKLLEQKKAAVFDARPAKEYAVSHIPGAVNVSAKPGVSISLYISDVAEIGRLVQNKKDSAIVLYCNGPHCGKSKRLAEELVEAGYTNVKRYQLGIPVWRALVGITEIEEDALPYVREKDQTAVWLDARDPQEFAADSIPNTRNLPLSGVKPGKDAGEVKKAKDDGRLPMYDHNTRIIVFGRDGAQAKGVAEALAREAFQNVSYFEGTVEKVRKAISR